MNTTKKIKKLVSQLQKQLENKDIEKSIVKQRSSILVKRIERYLRKLEGEIWNPSLSRKRRVKMIESLAPLYQELNQLPSEFFLQLDFSLIKDLLQNIYLTGGEKTGERFLSRLSEQEKENSQHIASLADLAMDIGLFSLSIELFKILKKRKQININEMYNLVILLYMKGNTQEAYKILRELEGKRGTLPNSSLKASILIALNRLKEAKSALGRF